MQPASRPVKQATGDRSQPHHQRVEPDQRIENEVRAQTAQPAVLQPWNGMWTEPRRGGRGNRNRLWTAVQLARFDRGAFRLIDR